MPEEDGPWCSDLSQQIIVPESLRLFSLSPAAMLTTWWSSQISPYFSTIISDHYVVASGSISDNKFCNAFMPVLLPSLSDC